MTSVISKIRDTSSSRAKRSQVQVQVHRHVCGDPETVNLAIQGRPICGCLGLLEKLGLLQLKAQVHHRVSGDPIVTHQIRSNCYSSGDISIVPEVHYY